MMLLNHWYDFTDVVNGRIGKRFYKLHTFLWFSIGRLDPISYDSMKISQ
ncbi:MAG: hypothetical protein ACMUEL_04535 [Flavobacteriales bacterium Tduv]